MKLDRRTFLAAGSMLPAMSAAEQAAARLTAGYTVEGLTTEYLKNPMGLEVERPRFSWRVVASERGVRQTAYRIRVAGTREALAAGRCDLWDSGRIASSKSFDIPYAGAKLSSRQRAWWSVESWDDRGRRALSDIAWFEMGLLSSGDWHGQWIEAETEESRADRLAGPQWIWAAKALDSRPHRFRLAIDVEKSLARAELLVSGKDRLTGVWVNGAQVEVIQPVFGHRHATYWGSLAAFPAPLRPGRNVIGVEVEADTSGFFPVDGGAMAALIRLHFTDGSERRIVSGPDWKVMPDAPAGWTAPSFDDRTWPAARKSGSDAQGDPREPEPAIQLRRAFIVGKRVVRARLYATALGAYQASLNGRRTDTALLAPEISLAKDHVYYQAHDVTGLLRQGDNVLGVLVGSGWYGSAFGWRLERYGFGPAPRRLLAQLVIDYEDGSSETIATGPDWQQAVSPIDYSEIYHGEKFDGRRRTPGWDTPGFDASDWAKARIGQTPPARLIAQVSPPLRAMQERRPVKVTHPASGVAVIDFGQNFSGWVRLKAKGPAGAQVTLKFAELLKADGSVDMANLRGADCTDRYTLAGDPGGEIWEPAFTYHGFRYVQVEGYPGDLPADAITGIVVHNDCAETGHLVFERAPLLQKIWNNALWSQRSNFFAVPTDCPQRDERMGWMGDIQVFLDAAAFNMDVDGFIRRFLDEVRAAQREDGAYPIVVPQPLSFPDVVTAGWSEAGIILPWTLWRRYGDRRTIDDNWTAMTRWMDYVAANSPDHVWRTGRGLDLGDWLSVDAVNPDDETTPRILCATAYYAFVAQLMAEMAGATGRGAEAARYQALREAIGAAFAREFVKPDGTVGNGSQTSHVLALHFGLVPEGSRKAAAEKLAADIRRRGMKLSTGFLGTPYLLDVLAEGGQQEVVAGLLLQTGYPSWGYMPVKGATTMWERWNGDVGDVSMNSYNHYAFGAVAGFMYRRLAGIAPAEPGFAKLSVRPFHHPSIGPVRAEYRSTAGRIASSVDGDASGVRTLALEVPANVTAEVVLPAGAWREGPRAVAGHPEVKLVRQDADGVVLEVGSGSYRFTR